MRQAKCSSKAVSSTTHNSQVCLDSKEKNESPKEKKESTNLSRFQALGHLCGWADGLVGVDDSAANTIGAILGFGAELVALGFKYYDPVHLLSAPNWKIRMYVAWCIIGGGERALATNLDYNEVRNYWPSIEFCDPSWNDEVSHWISKLALHDGSCEFRVAVAVGKPPRPQLILKL